VSREAKILTAILVVVVGGLIGLFVIANRPAPTPKGDKTKITRPTSHKEGSGTIQMVEFGDYQCPACGAAYPNVQQLLKDYGSHITFYFRNFPLTQLHPNAMASAQAAEAAGAQGKFWQMHDLLYQSQQDWGSLTTVLSASDVEAKFVSYAGQLGLDVNKFKSDYTSDAIQNIINQDLADATALNLQGTPTFYFNGQPYSGASDYASLRDKVSSLLGGSPAASPSPTPTPPPAQ